MSAYDPDDPTAIGPWAVATFEHVESAVPIATAYGPMPRSAAEALLEHLDLPEPWTVPLQPARATVEVEGVLTRVVVVFGREAVRVLLGIDNAHGLDPLDRWRRASAERGLTFPEYPTHEVER